MKALQLKEFGQLEVVELQNPQPGPDEVLIDVVATGICGTDIHGFTGENGRRVPGQVMGHESVGRVSALGEGVSGFKSGLPVTFNPVVVPKAELETFVGREQLSPNKQVIGVTPQLVSSFAQQIVVPGRNVVALPETMPIELGALVEPLAVAVHAVRRAQVKNSDAVLVLGGGPIGQSAVLALQMVGVENIVVTEKMPSRRNLVTALGVEAIDASAEDVSEQIFSAFGGLADKAIDAVGIEATVRLGLQATSLGATICLVGMGAPQFTLDAFKISTEERHLTGSFTYSAQDFQDAASWMGTGPPQALRLISRQVPIIEAQDEFTYLAQGGETPGKVLVMLGEQS